MTRTVALLLICLTVVPALGQEDLRMILPPRLYALPGVEMNVYFDNVLLAPNSGDLLYDVDCSFGQQQEERWTGIPDEANVGQARLTLSILTPEVEVIEQAEAMIEIVDPAAGQGKEITVLCVGDSLTAASQYTARLVELFSTDEAVEATLIGENGPGEETGNRHEGYGGWTCARFATLWNEEDYAERGGRMRRARSPFVFEIDGEPQLDFQRYLDANNGGEAPDFITILLGCNDTFGADETNIEASIDTMFGHLDALLAEFQRVAPETEIGLLTLVPPAASQDAFGRNYRCGQTRWQYRRNQHRVVERQYETYSGREEEGLSLVPAHVNLDTVWGFPRTRVSANAHTEAEVSRMSNGVHPARAGYYQIGDSIYCWLKSRLAAP